MPNYTYECENCENIFDKYFSYKENPREFIPCPKCKNKSKRKINISAVVYKGSGFYTTDKDK